MDFTKNTSLSFNFRPIVLAASLGSGLFLGACAHPSSHAGQENGPSEAPKAFFIPERQQAARGGKSATRHRPPTAEPFPEQQGYVYSPHTTPRKLVNITAFVAGDRVLCPYTLEPFIIPSPTPQQSQSPSIAAPPADSPLRSLSTLEERDETTNVDSSDVIGHPAVTEIASQELTPSLLPTSSGPPVGTWVEGIPGRVYSPFAPKHQQVDVSGLAPGVEVKCPYTGKIFRVPELSALDHTAASTLPGMVAPLPEPILKDTAPPEADLPPPPPAPVPPTDMGDITSEPSPTAEPSEETDPPSPAEVPSPEAPRFGAKPEPTSLPTAVWAGSDRTKVQSPFGQPGELVDVTGRAAGEKVVCPYTGKPFLVPAP